MDTENKSWIVILLVVYTPYMFTRHKLQFTHEFWDDTLSVQNIIDVVYKELKKYIVFIYCFFEMVKH